MIREQDGGAPMTAGRVLLATWQGGGNVTPEIGLARQLVARGHRVRVLSEATVQPEAISAGCAFSHWRSAPATGAMGPDALIHDWGLRGRLMMVPNVSRHLLFGPAGRFARDLMETLAAHPADVLLIDAALFGALVGAERAGLPTVALMPNIYIRPTRGRPVMGTGWLPATGPAGRVRDVVAPALFLRLLGLGLTRLNTVRAELGLPPVREVLELLDRCARLLVMTSPTFDPPPIPTPRNVRYVGANLDDPAWAEPYGLPATVPGQPFVLVGMSSTYQAHQGVLNRIVEALAGLPVTALVTLGPALRRSEVPAAPNVAVVASAPHSELLPRAALMITHAGHGSVMKALSAGVPVVCVPHGRDQVDNAARVVSAGAGVQLSRRAGTATIRQAVRRALENPSLRANAHRLAGTFSAEATSIPSAVEEIEQLM